MRRAVLGVLAMNVADAFTCTGFDPVYAPQSKREQAVLAGGGSGVHLSTAGAAVPVTSEDRIRQLNDGVRRYLSSVEESQRHHGGRVLQSANDPFDVSPVKPFRLDQVSLEAGSRLQQQQALDLEYMVWLDPNSILYNFRNTSGLPLQGAQPFGGEYLLDIDYRRAVLVGCCQLLQRFDDANRRGSNRRGCRPAVDDDKIFATWT